MVRSFRLAGSLAAHQVVASLIRARLSLADARDTAQRQLAAEEKKKASKVTHGWCTCTLSARSVRVTRSECSVSLRRGCSSTLRWLLQTAASPSPGFCLGLSSTP